MAETRRRLSRILLALMVALLIAPHAALAEGEDDWYDGWYEDSYTWDDGYSVDEGESSWDDESYESGWYEPDYSWEDESYEDESYEDESYEDESYEDESYEDESYEDAWYSEEYSYEEDAWDYSWNEDSYDEGESSYDDDVWYQEDDSDASSSYVYDSTGGWLFGVDVSEWNGTIDWDLVSASGIDFAILKCGGSDDWGGCYTDSEFVNNALACQRLGIPFGVYFYSTASSAWEAAIEAEYTVQTIAGLYPSLPVFIDMESSWLASDDYANVLCDVAQTFCEHVSWAGYYPGIYASLSWWECYLTDPSLDQWYKWVAQYNGCCEYEGCQFWQSSRWGVVDGIDWSVDIDYWFV